MPIGTEVTTPAPFPLSCTVSGYWMIERGLRDTDASMRVAPVASLSAVPCALTLLSAPSPDSVSEIGPAAPCGNRSPIVDAGR